MKSFVLILFACLFFINGCDDTDVWMATEAGIDAVKAATLSDKAVHDLATQSSQYADSHHTIALPDNEYSVRLRNLVGDQFQDDTFNFNFKVYLSDTVNAFAMADGTIRIYSGLMDMLNDGEVRFVVGHEMGHVAKEHIRKRIQLAYAASAVRKGLASQNNTIGDLARSRLGGFVEILTGAQFSQLEEKEADDYGLSFMKQRDYDPKDAVSALKKLAALGSSHSFLSSHPAPEIRAERLQLQLEGKTLSIDATKKTYWKRITSFFKDKFSR